MGNISGEVGAGGSLFGRIEQWSGNPGVDTQGMRGGSGI